MTAVGRRKRAAGYGGATDLSNRRINCYTGVNLSIDLEMDRKGIAKVAVGPQLRHAVHDLVERKAMPYAVGISPYDPTRKKGRHYRDSFVVRDGYTTIAGMRRVATRLWNISDHSVEVEWINNQQILTRTLGFLDHESVLKHAMDSLGRQEKFKPDQHPRGARGRFIRRTTEPDNAGDVATQAKRGAAVLRRATDQPSRYRNRKNEPSTPSKPKGGER